MKNTMLTMFICAQAITSLAIGQKPSQPNNEAAPSVSHFEGDKIPDFFAWQAFFKRADREYRLGLGYYPSWRVKSRNRSLCRLGVISPKSLIFTRVRFSLAIRSSSLAMNIPRSGSSCVKRDESSGSSPKRS